MGGAQYLFVFLCTVYMVASKLHQVENNITTVITGYGYPVEIHIALTSDGYGLILHRIPQGKQVSPRKGAVLLQHGLTDSSAGWCLNPPDQSLPFILADNGYDVWLGNNRGNGYSMTNTNFGTGDPRFWDFSWDDMALIDFPTMVDYVSTNSQFSKIHYIGHSEGTIQAFAGLCTDSKTADKLHVFIGLAPVAYVGGITVELFTLLAKLDADDILRLLGVNEFFLPDIAHRFLPEICKITPGLCDYGGAIFYGKDSYLNESRLDYYTDYEPFPTSTKNIVHWAQGVRTGTFQRYDYGTQGNIAHYNQPTPPPYPLKNYPTSLPLVLVTGGIDGLADPSDVAKLLQQISVQPTIYTRNDYGHLDPLLGDQAYKLTYPSILAELGKYQ